MPNTSFVNGVCWGRDLGWGWDKSGEAHYSSYKDKSGLLQTLKVLEIKHILKKWRVMKSNIDLDHKSFGLNQIVKYMPAWLMLSS